MTLGFIVALISYYVLTFEATAHFSVYFPSYGPVTSSLPVSKKLSVSFKCNPFFAPALSSKPFLSCPPTAAKFTQKPPSAPYPFIVNGPAPPPFYDDILDAEAVLPPPVSKTSIPVNVADSIPSLFPCGPPVSSKFSQKPLSIPYPFIVNGPAPPLIYDNILPIKSTSVLLPPPVTEKLNPFTLSASVPDSLAGSVPCLLISPPVSLKSYINQTSASSANADCIAYVTAPLSYYSDVSAAEIENSSPLRDVSLRPPVSIRPSLSQILLNNALMYV